MDCWGANLGFMKTHANREPLKGQMLGSADVSCVGLQAQIVNVRLSISHSRYTSILSAHIYIYIYVHYVYIYSYRKIDGDEVLFGL